MHSQSSQEERWVVDVLLVQCSHSVLSSNIATTYKISSLSTRRVMRLCCNWFLTTREDGCLWLRCSQTRVAHCILRVLNILAAVAAQCSHVTHVWHWESHTHTPMKELIHQIAPHHVTSYHQYAFTYPMTPYTRQLDGTRVWAEGVSLCFTFPLRTSLSWDWWWAMSYSYDWTLLLRDYTVSTQRREPIAHVISS